MFISHAAGINDFQRSQPSTVAFALAAWNLLEGSLSLLRAVNTVTAAAESATMPSLLNA